MSSDRYFIARLTGQEGPLSLEQVRVGLRNGRYTGKEMSWSESQAGEWMALNERPEFSSTPLRDEEIDELPAFKAEPRPADPPPRPLEIDLASLRRTEPRQFTTEQIELVQRAGIAWRRFLARQVDITVCGMLVVLLWRPASQEAFMAAYGLVALLVIALCPWVESLFIATLGNTPGKALLKLRLVRDDGQRPDFALALKRNLHVWIRGLALGLPLLNLVACVLSFNQYTRSGRTHWDLLAGTTVIAAPISHARLGIILGVFIAAAVFATLPRAG